VFTIGLFGKSKKNSLIKKAHKLFSQGKYQEALECYDKIISEIDSNYIKYGIAKELF